MWSQEQAHAFLEAKNGDRLCSLSQIDHRPCRVPERVWGFKYPRAPKKKAPASHFSEGEPSWLLVDVPVASAQPTTQPPRDVL